MVFYAWLGALQVSDDMDVTLNSKELLKYVDLDRLCNSSSRISLGS